MFGFSIYIFNIVIVFRYRQGFGEGLEVDYVFKYYMMFWKVYIYIREIIRCQVMIS